MVKLFIYTLTLYMIPILIIIPMSSTVICFIWAFSHDRVHRTIIKQLLISGYIIRTYIPLIYQGICALLLLLRCPIGRRVIFILLWLSWDFDFECLFVKYLERKSFLERSLLDSCLVWLTCRRLVEVWLR